MPLSGHASSLLLRRHAIWTASSSQAGGLEHFGKKLRTKTDIEKSEVAVHLSSCMVTDNHHHDRCPHVDQIKDTIRRHGLENIIEGTYRSKTTSKLRESGMYKVYDSVAFD